MRKIPLNRSEYLEIDRELKAMSDRLTAIAITLQKSFPIRGAVDKSFVTATNALGKARRKLAGAMLDQAAGVQAADVQAADITEAE